MAGKKASKAYRYDTVPIAYHQAKCSWFIWDNTAYPVADCASTIFRSAILEQAPIWRQHNEYWPLLRQKEIEFESRWYLLCGLSYAGKRIVLYSSQEDAEQACPLQSAK
jgi:hypothetical protein